MRGVTRQSAKSVLCVSGTILRGPTYFEIPSFLARPNRAHFENIPLLSYSIVLPEHNLSFTYKHKVASFNNYLLAYVIFF